MICFGSLMWSEFERTRFDHHTEHFRILGHCTAHGHFYYVLDNQKSWLKAQQFFRAHSFQLRLRSEHSSPLAGEDLLRQISVKSSNSLPVAQTQVVVVHTQGHVLLKTWYCTARKRISISVRKWKEKWLKRLNETMAKSSDEEGLSTWKFSSPSEMKCLILRGNLSSSICSSWVSWESTVARHRSCKRTTITESSR